METNAVIAKLIAKILYSLHTSVTTPMYPYPAIAYRGCSDMTRWMYWYS
jgi:hypothetical protein